LCSSKGFSTKYSPSQTPALVTYLNGLTSSVIVLIATYDETQAAFNLPIPADMINAIKRCSGSNDFGYSDDTPAGILLCHKGLYPRIIYFVYERFCEYCYSFCYCYTPYLFIL